MIFRISQKQTQVALRSFFKMLLHLSFRSLVAKAFFHVTLIIIFSHQASFAQDLVSRDFVAQPLKPEAFKASGGPVTSPHITNPISFLDPKLSQDHPSFSLWPKPNSSSSNSSSSPGSSSDSTENKDSSGFQQSLLNSANSSNASSNSSYSIPGQYVPKKPVGELPASTARDEFLRIKKGWVVSYTYKIFNPKQPTLVMMPGIYRGLEKEEEALRLLESYKINFVSIQFSTHAKSFINLEAQEKPYFEGGQGASAERFAQEVEAVVDQLNIKNPVVVALSYSAVVAPRLNPRKFPYVIQAAPMGRFDESNLLGGVIQRTWENWMSLVPVYGTAYVQWLKMQTYFSEWSIATKILAQFRPELQDQTVFKRQVDGFVAMNIAAENFDLSQQNYQDGVLRAWIVGESEDPTRAYFQSVAIKKYLSQLPVETFKNSAFGLNGVFIIKGSGHIIPNDQPVSYCDSLKAILEGIKK